MTALATQTDAQPKEPTLGETVAVVVKQTPHPGHAATVQKRVDDAADAVTLNSGWLTIIGAVLLLALLLPLVAPAAGAWFLADELTSGARVGAIVMAVFLTGGGTWIAISMLINWRGWISILKLMLWLALWSAITFGPEWRDLGPEWVRSGWLHVGLLGIAFFPAAVGAAVGLVGAVIWIATVAERRTATSHPESALINDLARAVKDAKKKSEETQQPGNAKALEKEVRTWVTRLDVMAARFESDLPRRLHTGRYGVDRVTRVHAHRIGAEVRRAHSPLLLARLKNSNPTIDYATLRDDLATALVRIIVEPEALPPLDAQETETARESRIRQITQSTIFGLSLVIAALLATTVFVPDLGHTAIAGMSPDLWDFLESLDNALVISAAGTIVAAASGWLWNSRILSAVQTRRGWH